VSAENAPLNVWSTSLTCANVCTSGTPSPVVSSTIFFRKTFEIAWRFESSLTSPHGASSPESVVLASSACSLLWSATSPPEASSALISAVMPV
jgi:hypothetical protein